MKTNRKSFVVSLFIHLSLMFLFLGITFKLEYEVDDFEFDRVAGNIYENPELLEEN